jgi:RNA polymerase sigma factor (sigma-70 family)
MVRKQPSSGRIPLQQDSADSDGVVFRSSVETGGIAYREWSDLDLVASLADECGDAYAELYRRHSQSVAAAARMILVNDDRSEDVVAEVFVALWLFPEKFDPERGTVLSFLRVKARGRSVDMVRMEMARRRREVADLRLPRPPMEAIDSRVLDSEFSAALREGVRQLPAGERESIELAFFSGLSYSAVAGELGIPEGTVKGRIRNGLKRLQSDKGIRLHWGVEQPLSAGVDLHQPSATGSAS